MAARLAINPEQGMEVVATGRMSTFPGQSRYQLIIDSLEPAGVGALMALFEERKKKLAAEGLFAPERKRPLPFLPDVIGVVTSPLGRGHSRYSAPPARALSPARDRLADAGAGEGRGRKDRRGD